LFSAQNLARFRALGVFFTNMLQRDLKQLSDGYKLLAHFLPLLAFISHFSWRMAVLVSGFVAK